MVLCMHVYEQEALFIPMSTWRHTAGTFAFGTACLSAGYLFTIMPRMVHRPDRSAFRTRFYAHRGLHENGTGRPENSLAAIRAAADAGFGIEMDIQVTKDNVPVVFHDFLLWRMCRQRGRVCDYTLEELRRFRLLNSEEGIPTFAEALAAVDGRVPLIIEMKVEHTDLRVCREADRLLRDYKGPYSIESFNPLVLFWYRKNRPDVMRGQLSDGFIHQREFRRPAMVCQSFFLQFLVTNCVTRPDFIAYNFKYQGNPSRRLVRRLFRAREAAWTIKSEADLQKAKAHFDVFIFDSFLPRTALAERAPERRHRVPDKTERPRIGEILKKSARKMAPGS